MKRILIDTNIYVAFKRGQTEVFGLLRQSEYIGMSTIVIGELLAGFRCGNREMENRRELDEFLDSPRLEILPLDENTADFYAEVFRALKQKGKPIPSNDIWLAASALQHGLAMATFDEHFRQIDGLRLANPERSGTWQI